ncbi:class I histocompatibility antigen, F10 alpha chain-like [Gopherus evgoodei]|uniref:Class I histocompatibility antigen, F10 alpha chain-like n=1 Tax=Gopherus evgoodei TaxID=1825980 RepID=A0A8C4YSJ9_9SAUR|nr:class I histocompatibility antigen, F10 alpha chain-like [Gopherus evgoodei]
MVAVGPSGLGCQGLCQALPAHLGGVPCPDIQGLILYRCLLPTPPWTVRSPSPCNTRAMAWGLLLALCGLLAPAASGGHHSLAVLVTAVINEDRTHHFIMIARLDDVKIAYYRSDTREVRPTQEWVAQTLGIEYLQEKTQQFWRHEEGSKVETRRWMQLYNQTGGVHTEQVHVGCALSDQAPMDPRFQFAYNGRDFISFDNQTGTWVAAVQPAFAPKQHWETAGKVWTKFVQQYLQSECLGTLQSLVLQGRAVLEQQVPPKVSVFRRDALDGSITLSCCARGFHPRPVHVSWVRDGEDILAETDSSGILPNADSTYYMQSSLEISPQQDRHRYACRVEHSSLGEPTLIWAPGKKGSLPPGVLAAIILAVLVLAGAIGAGIVLWRRKSAGPKNPGYAPAATKSGEDSVSSSSSGTDLRSVGPQC